MIVFNKAKEINLGIYILVSLHLSLDLSPWYNGLCVFLQILIFCIIWSLIAYNRINSIHAKINTRVIHIYWIGNLVNIFIRWGDNEDDVWWVDDDGGDVAAASSAWVTVVRLRRRLRELCSHLRSSSLRPRSILQAIHLLVISPSPPLSLSLSLSPCVYVYV